MAKRATEDVFLKSASNIPETWFPDFSLLLGKKWVTHVSLGFVNVAGVLIVFLRILLASSSSVSLDLAIDGSWA